MHPPSPQSNVMSTDWEMHKALLAQPKEEVVEHLPPVVPPQDEEMAEAPPLPVEEYMLPQMAPPLPEQTLLAQIVVEEEKMEGVELIGLLMPLYTPYLPNAGVAWGPHFPTTPHQPTPQLTATLATPAISHVAIP